MLELYFHAQAFSGLRVEFNFDFWMFFKWCICVLVIVIFQKLIIINNVHKGKYCNHTVFLKYYILFLEQSLTALESHQPHENLLSDITQKYLEFGEEYFEVVLKESSLGITKMYNCIYMYIIISYLA